MRCSPAVLPGGGGRRGAGGAGLPRAPEGRAGAGRAGTPGKPFPFPGPVPTLEVGAQGGWREDGTAQGTRWPQSRPCPVLSRAATEAGRLPRVPPRAGVTPLGRPSTCCGPVGQGAGRGARLPSGVERPQWGPGCVAPRPRPPLSRAVGGGEQRKHAWLKAWDRSLTSPFIHSFVRSFIHSFIHSFIQRRHNDHTPRASACAEAGPPAEARGIPDPKPLPPQHPRCRPTLVRVQALPRGLRVPPISLDFKASGRFPLLTPPCAPTQVPHSLPWLSPLVPTLQIMLTASMSPSHTLDLLQAAIPMTGQNRTGPEPSPDSFQPHVPPRSLHQPPASSPPWTGPSTPRTPPSSAWSQGLACAPQHMQQSITERLLPIDHRSRCAGFIRNARNHVHDFGVGSDFFNRTRRVPAVKGNTCEVELDEDY